MMKNVHTEQTIFLFWPDANKIPMEYKIFKIRCIKISIRQIILLNCFPQNFRFEPIEEKNGQNDTKNNLLRRKDK